MQPPPVVRSEVDGIPVFAVEGPGPFTAHLQFRVGVYDESLRDRGITHLIEHMALFRLRNSEVAFNGVTSSHLTTFSVQGRPDEAGAFLRDVCRFLHDLPFDRLDVEADVLHREEAAQSRSYFDEIMRAYFGPRGPGVAPFRQFGLRWLPPDRIRDWAGRYFTRQNAALLIVGEEPASWGLELPDGEAMPYIAPERPNPSPAEPALLGTQHQGVTWATLVRLARDEQDAAFTVGFDIVARRLRDRLRHELGETYAVTTGWRRVDAELLAASHGFDCDPARSRAVALEHLAVMREFMAEGPTPEEIESIWRAQLRFVEDHPFEVGHGQMTMEAEAFLAGWGPATPWREHIRRKRDLEPDAVAARFREAYRQSFTIADLPPGELAPGPAARPLRKEPLAGVEFRLRRRSRRADVARRVRVGPSGVSLHYRRGWDTIPTEEITLVVDEEPDLYVIDDTRVSPIGTDDYRPAAQPWKALVRPAVTALAGLVLFLSLVAAGRDSSSFGTTGTIALSMAGILIALRFFDRRTRFPGRGLSLPEALRT